MKNTLHLAMLASALAGFTAIASAQSTSAPRPGRHGPGRPPEPLLIALDTNHDGVISAGEIANAAASLKALDQNGDGKLTRDEICPPRPADAPPPPPDAEAHRPKSPLLLALDADGNGELSAQEIANAPASLAALDANHDGQLTRDELRPLPPEGAQDLPPPPEN